MLLNIFLPSHSKLKYAIHKKNFFCKKFCNLNKMVFFFAFCDPQSPVIKLVKLATEISSCDIVYKIKENRACLHLIVPKNVVDEISSIYVSVLWLLR